MRYAILMLSLVACGADEPAATSEAPAVEAPVEAPAAKAPAKTEAAEAAYACPMHPKVTSDAPGDCNVCGMKLEKTGEDKEKAGKKGHDAHGDHGGHDH